MIFTKCFARGIGNDDNSRTKCLFDLYFFLCSIELNTLLLVPNKPITDLRMNFLFFWSIFGHGCGPYGHIRIFPTWNFFLGLAGFITNLFQVRNLLNLIVQIYPHIKLD